MIPVLLARSSNYDQKGLLQHFDLFAAHLHLPDHFSGSTVLLKPNLISWRGSDLACTDCRFVAAAAHWFHDRGARVCIGDSPAFGSASLVMRARGITRLINHLGLEVVEFKTPLATRLPHWGEIGIAREALDCDLLVNLPKIKAHNQMFMTIAVKNLFGIVVGMRKAAAHMKNGSSHLKFADLLLNLIDVLPEHLSLVDGITVMHRQGPIGGEPLELGCVAAGRDPVALDAALLDCLELDVQRAPIWRAARRRGCAGSICENFIFPLKRPVVFHGSGFIAPETLNPVPFNPARYLVSIIRRAWHGCRS